MVDIVSKLNDSLHKVRGSKVMNMDNVTVTDSYQAVKTSTRGALAKKPYNEQYRTIPKMTTKTPTWNEIGGLLAKLNADTLIPDNKDRNLVDIGILKRMPFEQSRLIKDIKLFGIHNLIPTRNVDAFRCMCVNGSLPDIRVSVLKRGDNSESIRIYTNKGFIEIIKLNAQ